MILGVALAMGSAANPFLCYAWGDLGHKIICQIAFQELNDRARAEVIRLVSLASNFEPSPPGACAAFAVNSSHAFCRSAR